MTNGKANEPFDCPCSRSVLEAQIWVVAPYHSAAGSVTGIDPLGSVVGLTIVLELSNPSLDWQFETLPKKPRYYDECGEMQAASQEISSVVPCIGLSAWSRGFDSLYGLAPGVGGNAAGWQLCGLRPPLSACDP